MPALVVILLANTFWTAGATAQSMSRNDVFGRYQQINWQERDGLPQNTVLAIATTRDGYLWMGTYEGAARFDGVRFTLFNPSNTTGIGNSFVTSLLERRDGDLWLATYGGGVSRLSGGRSRSTPCEMGCRATSPRACSKTAPARSGSAPTAAV